MELSENRKLALFDLDNTLLGGDSDHAWGEFLIERGLVKESEHRARNNLFYKQYQQQKLDIHDYVAFTLTPILKFDHNELQELHADFMKSAVKPMILDKSLALLKKHRNAGDFCVIITATNEFITRPIAQLFEVDYLLSTELEMENGYYNGKISGIPCYQDGKVKKIMQWLNESTQSLSLSNSISYSDSVNDLPLLNATSASVAVDPDSSLRAVAEQANWPIISLRE